VRKKHRNIQIILLIVVLEAVFLCTSCNLLSEEKDLRLIPALVEDVEVRYQMETVKRGNIEIVETILVEYVPVQTESLSFNDSGISYGNFYVTAGEMVQAGELLAELDLTSFREEEKNLKESILSLEEEKEYAERECSLKEREIPYKMAGLSQADIEQEKSILNKSYDRTIRELEENIALQKMRLEECEQKILERQIIAPFDGVIEEVYEPAPDELSKKGSTVIIISDSSMSLFKGETVNWALFEEGEEYIVKVGGQDYLATAISPESIGLQKETYEEGKRGKVYLMLKGQTSDLFDGDKGKVSFLTDSAENTLLVPSGAVVKINDKDAVFVLDAEGMRSFCYVETGIRNNQYIEILSGLAEGDSIIVK